MTTQLKQRFLGPWIGETQGYEMPAHLWSIRDQYGASYITIDTTWEGASGAGGMLGSLREFEGRPAFWIESFQAHGTGLALLVDASHFIIPGWDTNDTRSNLGPAYDVVFSRPGVAELNARDVWRKCCGTDLYRAAVGFLSEMSQALLMRSAQG